MIDLIIFFGALGLGYFVGSRIERAHYHEIREREEKLSHLPAVTGKNFLQERPIASSQFVISNVVISADFFKQVFTGLRNLFGGRISAAESVVDRARREVVLRLKEQVPNADIILNVRMVTSRINLGISVEAMAYGTAVTYAK